MPKIKETYIDAGLVRYVFKDFPLAFHPNARQAAEASRCAGAQGAYWEMHHQLFQAQGAWSSLSQPQGLDAFVGYAQDLGLDADAFRTCVESGQFAAQIDRSIREGRLAGVQGTPSFLINDQFFVGAYPFKDFQEIIEAELNE